MLVFRVAVVVIRFFKHKMSYGIRFLRFLSLESLLSHFLATFLPVFSLALQARADITAELLSKTFDLEKVATVSISANADTARLKVFPPQYVIENRPNATNQIPVRRLNRAIAPEINQRSEGINEFTNHIVAGPDWTHREDTFPERVT